MRFAFVWLVVMIAASVAASDTTDSTRKALATKETTTSVVAKPSAHQRRRLGWSPQISEWLTKLGEKAFIQKIKAFFRKFWPSKTAKTTTEPPVDNPSFPHPVVPLHAQSDTIPITKVSPVSPPGMSASTKLNDPPVPPSASIPVVEPIKPPVSTIGANHDKPPVSTIGANLDAPPSSFSFVRVRRLTD
ncbi:hypothetical protein CCR75_002288 [Bremia lactucae]|uniref:Uncharacterized protein n=1 Tax=Bremia lactucae TaxID=4779 RepID=A0A976FM20_BRELC|nr:hypothetical protein CCR75_002288 [Bremia lactucae]